MKRFKKNLLATAITALLAGMSVGAADAKTELKLATLAPEWTLQSRNSIQHSTW